MPVLGPSQNESSLPVVGNNTNPIGGMTNAREAQTVRQPQSNDTTFLWHEDNGVRIPFAQQGNVVELPHDRIRYTLV